VKLDNRILAVFSHPLDLKGAACLLDHMRFRLGMTYKDCAARVTALVPGLDFEGVSQEIDAMEAGADG
jgi:hypothetical protein